MRTISFKDFTKYYREYYGDHHNKYFNIRTEEDMEEVIFDIYGINKFEIDYENEIIELY